MPIAKYLQRSLLSKTDAFVSTNPLLLFTTLVLISVSNVSAECCWTYINQHNQYSDPQCWIAGDYLNICAPSVYQMNFWSTDGESITLNTGCSNNGEAFLVVSGEYYVTYGTNSASSVSHDVGSILCWN